MLNKGSDLGAFRRQERSVPARVPKTQMFDLPGILACSSVLNFAIGAHEAFCLQSVSITVTAEVALMLQVIVQKE
ncbi:MAG: hypothetical protein WBE74_20705 [Terracidiphilus sp.]